MSSGNPCSFAYRLINDRKQNDATSVTCVYLSFSTLTCVNDTTPWQKRQSRINDNDVTGGSPLKTRIASVFLLFCMYRIQISMIFYFDTLGRKRKRNCKKRTKYSLITKHNTKVMFCDVLRKNELCHCSISSRGHQLGQGH